MSDLPPPPPPGPLTPPPGYVSYDQGAPEARPVRGLARALVILLAVVAAATVVNALVQVNLAGDGEDLLANRITDAEFEDRLAPLAAIGLLVGGVSVAVTVLQILWSYRIAKNLQSLRRGITFTPGRSIAVWILGGCTLNIVNFFLLREHWKASAPLPRGVDDATWRREPVTPLIPLWLVLNILSLGVGVASGLRSFQGVNLGNTNEDLAEALADVLGLVIASSVISILASLTMLAIVRQMTARHASATGEA